MNIEVLFLLVAATFVWLFKRWVFHIKREQRRDYYSNQTSGNENDMLCSKGITGNVYIVVLALRKFITKDMQERISEKNQLNGSFLFAKHVMIKNIVN